MNKCERCGKEFEGSFCPDCGKKYEEKRAKSAVEMATDRQLAVFKDIKRVVRHKQTLQVLLLAWLLGPLGIIAIIAAFALSFGKNVLDWSPNSINKEKKAFIGFAIAGGILAVAATVGGIVVFVKFFDTLMKTLFYTQYFLPYLIFGIIIFVAAAYCCCLGLSISALPALKRIDSALFKEYNLNCDFDAPVISVQELARTEAGVKEGKISVTVPSANEGLASAVAALLIVVIAVSVWGAISVNTNIFRKEVLDKITLGSSQSAVYDVLGAPDATNREDETDYYECSVWYYYDSSAKKYFDQIEKYEEQLEKAFMDGDFDEMDKVVQKYDAYVAAHGDDTYVVITVNYAYGNNSGSSGSRYAVESVELDTSYKFDFDSNEGSYAASYSTSDINLSKSSFTYDDYLKAVSGELKVTASAYRKGSGDYVKCYVPAYAFAEIDFNYGNSQNLVWESGNNSFTAQINLSGSGAF